MGKLAGSNPATSTIGNVAQKVEHQCEELGVLVRYQPLPLILESNAKWFGNCLLSSLYSLGYVVRFHCFPQYQISDRLRFQI